MQVLSLFDGMSCGMIALLSAGVEVDRYAAYEIDKYAVQTSAHNFPQIEHMGDVFQGDFTQYQGFDGVIGGSPCTFWSIAQSKNREVTPDGFGGRLFEQFFRAVQEAKPRFFIYENNKSMAPAIREYISGRFGFEPVCINSALVSAQNRQRLYWVGRRNEDGTYSRVEIQQPEDRGILLKDVLDGVGAKELSEKEMNYMVGDTHGKFSDRWTFTQKPGQKDKAECIVANISKGVPYNVCCEPVRVGDMPNAAGTINGGQSHRIYSAEGKSPVLCARPNGGGATTGQYAIPVNTTATGKAGTLRATCYKDGIRNMVANDVDRRTCVAEPLRVGTYPGASHPEQDSKQYRVYTPEGKAVTQCGQGGGLGAKTGLYALPVAVRERGREEGPRWEARTDGKANTLTSGRITHVAVPTAWDEDGVPLKAVSGADRKTYTVYRVQAGQITIKGKSYPIKLADGYYIIRKLTVTECMRLQTVPEWYDFSCVSNTQAYKMLGNGWTCEVIAHLIRACLKGAD